MEEDQGSHISKIFANLLMQVVSVYKYINKNRSDINFDAFTPHKYIWPNKLRFIVVVFIVPMYLCGVFSYSIAVSYNEFNSILI